jgi:stage II sporulation protein E
VETAIACLAFFFLPASLQERMQVESLGFAGDLKKNKMKMVDSYLQENAKNSMENLALVFSELSSTFAEKESCNMKNQETAYLNYLYAEINNQFCYHCSRYESCWGQDFYATSQEVLDIFALAEQNGGVLYEEDPPDFIRRCLYGKEMAHAINYLFDNVRTNEYWKQRLENSRQLISRQLTGLSRVIKNLAVGIDEKGYKDLAYRENCLKIVKD